LGQHYDDDNSISEARGHALALLLALIMVIVWTNKFGFALFHCGLNVWLRRTGHEVPASPPLSTQLLHMTGGVPPDIWGDFAM